ncbi:MAG: hypothetical protein H8E38_13600 [SAR324 cluster bacterium]|nr:hypothetical protein [SAR324 cluster bacterium]MBL7036115.1 hypothetical protein [SAR324 cluster bacterium]
MPAGLRINLVRIFLFTPFVIVFIFLLSFSSAAAQSNFVPLERGDVSEREEHLTFAPGVELSGDFRFRTSKIKSTALPQSRTATNSPEEFSFEQDVRLRLRSTVHRIISLNLELATNQEAIYQSDIRASRSSRTSGAESQAANITARQSYLELNRNPNEVAKIGKHVVNIGDRKGKVFAGILSGYSQRCKAGTWCYEIGGMKLSSADADWLYFFSLDYPFWHEVDTKGEIIDSLHIELFRIKYTEHDVPLGLNNVPAKRLSGTTLSSLESSGFTSGSACNTLLAGYTLNSSCKPIYYNAHEQEYFGLRLSWETPVWSIYADIISNQGNRDYYQYDDRHNLDKRKISGGAAELELSWKKPGGKFEFVAMLAGGDEQQDDSSKNGANYLRGLEGYYEISPGTYRGTQFYFNGGSPDLNSGTGLGHSINNTQLGGIRYYYEIPETTAVYRFGLYELKRIKPVLDVNGAKASMIGIEWDNTFSLDMASHAKLDLDFNAFQPGSAFSYDDHTAPTARTDMIFHFAGRLIYSF